MDDTLVLRLMLTSGLSVAAGAVTSLILYAATRGRRTGRPNPAPRPAWPAVLLALSSSPVRGLCRLGPGPA